MITKRELEVNLMIKEAYYEFNLEKIAQGMGDSDSMNYWRDIEHFLKHSNLCEDDYISVITSQTVNEYVVYMKTYGYKSATINHNLRSIRVFLYWCMNNNYLASFKIHLVKAQEEQIKFCTREELDKLLKAPNRDDFVEHRTYTVISFILGTGARLQTVLNLKLEDVDFKNRTITYRHLKNKKVATVPMSLQLSRILIDFIKSWNTESEYVFCGVDGRQMTSSSCQHSMANYCEKRGVKRKGPHSFRHTFAREWILNGGNAFTLQQMLTHSDLTMTRKYVRLFADDIRDTNFEKYVPLDNLKFAQSRTNTIKKITPQCTRWHWRNVLKI